MSQDAQATTLRWLDAKIARLRKMLVVELLDLEHSGFTPGNPMYDDLFFTITKDYYRDMLPYAVLRHQMKPFEREDETEFNKWMFLIFDATLNDPPEEVKSLSLSKLQSRASNKSDWRNK